MTNILLVPIHLDALYLNEKESVVEEMTDYSKLPYWDEDGQQNYGPYISDTVLSPPFEALNLSLEKGIHLHWALPDGLTRGKVAEDSSIQFPLVPNRWLIMRRGGDLPEKQWVVESDYLYADGAEPEEDTINILHDPTGGDGRPFRYLGRKQELSQWPTGGNAEYVEALSVMGPHARLTSLDNEKATFAAFYPNCRSVFGFHDDLKESPSEGLQYDVIGWYSTPDKDYLSKFIQESFKKAETFLADLERQLGGKPPEEVNQTSVVLAAIEKKLRWQLPEGVDPATLEGMLCYSRLTFTASGAVEDPAPQLERPSIAVGNSPTEALAAYLAHQLSDNPEDRLIIEEQLEALELSDRFLGQELDVGPSFDRERHQTGFSGESAGSVWRVTPGGNTFSRADARDSQAQEQTTLPPIIADQLNILNLRQQEYDRALAKIGMIREQLYADWHKYMLARYVYGDDENNYVLPTDDLLKDFIDLDEEDQGKYNGCSISDLEQAIAETGTLTMTTGDEEEVTGADAGSSAPDSIAARLAEAINDTVTTLNDFNNALRQLLSDQKNPSQLRYLLAIESAPGYWEANEPVILMTGDAVKYGNRHGGDGRLHPRGLLECQVLTEAIDMQRLPEATLEVLKAKLDALEPVEGEKIGFKDWSEQPWHPFLLHWAVKFFPVEHSSGKSDGPYEPDLLQNNYQLLVNEADLLLQEGAHDNFIDSAEPYEGACILTPSANTLLQRQIELYLTKVLLPGYPGYDESALPPVLPPSYPRDPDSQGAENSQNYFSLHWQEVKTWYEDELADTSEEDKVKDPIYTALRAYELLQSLDCLAQGLGGFNDALLTYKREMQLEVKDPLAVSENQGFHQRVREVLAQAEIPGSLLRGPLIFNPFNPWRTGALNISGLRIIDTFGRVKDVVDLADDETVEVVTTAAMTPPLATNRQVYLPPRLAQQARLNFQWMSASQGEMETNDHPATTPVCGWVVPNYLDNSLMVYKTHGQSLGMVQVRGGRPQWLPMPGRDSRPEIEEVKSEINPYLGQLLDYLVNVQNNESFFIDFLTAANTALESIEPDNYAQHQSIALMTGRPLALVRARVNLELKGPPSISQNHADTWVDVNADLEDTDTIQSRVSHDFAKVKLPIRIGDYRQLNDALVGYWIEASDNTYQDGMFYAPQGIYVPNQNIKTLFENQGDETPDTPINLEQTLEPETAQTLAILMDPRGKINATCGFLPARTIIVPPEQYAKALQSIEVTFLSAPIIGSPDRDRLQISLPTDADYTWSWLVKEGEEWSETTTIGQFDATANFAETNKIHEGWLKLSQVAEDNSGS